MYELIIFDFDGTLADTKEGVKASAKYALEKMGITVKNDDELKVFVGPALWDSFKIYYHITKEEDLRKAVALYREDYVQNKGLLRCEIYPGVKELLVRLKEQGIKFAVASAKPASSIKIVAEKLGIWDLFDCVEALEPDAIVSSKTQLLYNAMQYYDITDKQKVLVVGDRYTDSNAAMEAGIDFCGAIYDSAKEEFKGAPVKYYIDSPLELLDILQNEGFYA